jgi:hypothetical protein
MHAPKFSVSPPLAMECNWSEVGFSDRVKQPASIGARIPVIVIDELLECGACGTVIFA